MKVPRPLRLSLELPVNIEPADPKALRDKVRKSKAVLVAVGVVAGVAFKSWLDRVAPDEEEAEGDD